MTKLIFVMYTVVCYDPYYIQVLYITMHRLTLLLLFLLCTSSHAMAPKLNWNKAVEHVIKRYGLPIEPKTKRMFEDKGISYPPQDIALLAFKKEQEVQLWAKDENHSWREIHTYPLTAYSGVLGPKLRENDRQIPEGIYRLVSFNPFSSMHLSMMINYPNDFDRLQASKEGRRKLGNNIFLHGKSFSVGCLAVGDKAIDQLFLLAYRVGLNHVRLVIAPNDLRLSKPATPSFAQPRWTPELYDQIAKELSHYPLLMFGRNHKNSRRIT